MIQIGTYSRDDSPYFVDPEDHLVVLGTTKAGKSTLLENFALQLAKDRGVVLFDWHSDLADSFASKVPDAIILDPLSDRPLGINPFLDDDDNRAVERATSILASIYGDSSWLGQSALIGRNLAWLVKRHEETPTLLHLHKAFTNKAYRAELKQSADVALQAFLEKTELKSSFERTEYRIAPLTKLL